MPTTTVHAIELTRKGIEAKPKNATLSGRHTNIKGELVDTCAASLSMSSQNSAAEKRVKFLKKWMVETQSLLDKLTDQSSWMESGL